MKIRIFGSALVLSMVLACAPGVLSAQSAGVAGSIDRVTVPLIIDDGRPLVEVGVAAADGTRKSARFLVDTGGGAFIIPEPLARSLGIEWGEIFRGEGREFARPQTTPRAYLDEFELPLRPQRVLIAIGSDQEVESPIGLLPGHVLARHHVIFDYPGRALTLAAPGSIEPVGVPIPMPVSEPMGFPRTEIEVAGTTYGMLLDTGPAATIVSQAVIDDWQEAKPDWDHHDGAALETEALVRAGGQVLETLVLEDVEWAGARLDSLTAAAQREGVFERYISQMMTQPVVGALGSNAFMAIRLELDYRGQQLYVSSP